VVDDSGVATTQVLGPDAPVTVVVPPGGYLAPDEGDVHPFSSSYDVPNLGEIARLLVPTDPDALGVFETRSAAHQERAMFQFLLPPSTPEALVAIYRQLDSSQAQREALIEGCQQMGKAIDPAGWVTALSPLVKEPAIQSFNARYAACGTALAATAIKPELVELLAHPSTQSLARLEYLISFDFGPADSLALLSGLATQSPSLAIRERAISRLGSQAAGGYSAIPDDQVEAWKAFFRARLSEATSATRLVLVLNGVQGLRDVGALPQIASAIRTIPMRAFTQQRIICGAFRMSENQPTAWTAFQDALKPWDTLSIDAAKVLADPATCPPPR